MRPESVRYVGRGRRLGRLRPISLLALVALAAAVWSCSTPAAPTTALHTLPPSPVASSPAATSPAACQPTDQDRYVYRPYRLRVLAPCIRVTGTVTAIHAETDGDLHILLTLDPRFRQLLRPANYTEQRGDLVVEPICVGPPSQPDAIAPCAADPDPLSSPLPLIGAHVWMEGRYVLDLNHHGWAELHPLYRWGAW